MLCLKEYYDFNFEQFYERIENDYVISYVINERTSAMRENYYTDEELKLIISEKYTRIIDNAASISYNNQCYIPINIETGEITCFRKGTE